jgi:hypothetical protein
VLTRMASLYALRRVDAQRSFPSRLEDLALCVRRSDNDDPEGRFSKEGAWTGG